jgi:hypothetical protein
MANWTYKTLLKRLREALKEDEFEGVNDSTPLRQFMASLEKLVLAEAMGDKRVKSVPELGKEKKDPEPDPVTGSPVA